RSFDTSLPSEYRMARRMHPSAYLRSQARWKSVMALVTSFPPPCPATCMPASSKQPRACPPSHAFLKKPDALAASRGAPAPLWYAMARVRQSAALPFSQVFLTASTSRAAGAWTPATTEVFGCAWADVVQPTATRRKGVIESRMVPMTVRPHSRSVNDAVHVRRARPGLVIWHTPGRARAQYG